MKLRKFLTMIVIIEMLMAYCLCNRSYAMGAENEAKKESNISDNCLCLLSIDNAVFNPSFSSNIDDYETEIYHDMDSVNVIAIPEDESKKVEIIGDKGLKDGNNLIKVNVLSSSGKVEKTYEINVYRRNSEEEAKYQKEQEEVQKELMSSRNKEDIDASNKNIETKNNNYVFLIAIPGILAIVVVLAIIAFYYMRKV